MSHSCHSETLVRALHSARAARMSVVIWGTQVLHKLEIFGSFEINADADFCCLDIPFLSSRQRNHSENGCQAPVDKKGFCPVLPVSLAIQHGSWQKARVSLSLVHLSKQWKTSCIQKGMSDQSLHF